MPTDLPNAFPSTARTRVARHPERGTYDRDIVHAILDEALVCHVGFADAGVPFVIPTLYARLGDVLYVHGAAASRLLRALAAGAELCVTVTLLDGLVMARSAFSHSMNYRSVVILGRGRLVDEREEKLQALAAMVEHVAAGRWQDARQPSEAELGATLVVAVPLVEVSAKVRTGPPQDHEADYDWPAWAGVIPLRQIALDPIDDPRLAPDIHVPDYARGYTRPRS